jgi:hypothetical protein
LAGFGASIFHRHPELTEQTIWEVFEADPPPLKWSDLRYVYDIKEDRNGKEAIQA